MSSEIILDENILIKRKRVVHALQHDLESFFWVLCWLVTHFVMLGRMRAIEDIPEAVLELLNEETSAETIRKGHGLPVGFPRVLGNQLVALDLVIQTH